MYSQKPKIQLGNRAYRIQHTQIMLKSAVLHFYPKMHLKVYREPFSRNPSSLVCCSKTLVTKSFHKKYSLTAEWEYVIYIHINLKIILDPYSQQLNMGNKLNAINRRVHVKSPRTGSHSITRYKVGPKPEPCIIPLLIEQISEIRLSTLQMTEMKQSS